MSSESNTVVVAPVVVEKKVKAPTLGAKYSRFMAFGHWFVSQQSTELVSEEVREELYRKMMIFASLEEQTAFYEGFLSQVTATNKTIRKMVAVSKKPVKAPKAPRAKKTKAALPQDGLVAQLIADANSSDVEPVASETGEPVVVVAEKKPKAPRAKKTKATDAVVASETVEPVDAGAVAVAEKKPKAPRAKKTKEPVAAAAETVANTVLEPSPELVAEPVVETVVETVAPVSEGKKTKKTEKAEKAEKTDKPKKTKKTKAEPAATATEEFVEHDIETRIVTIKDKEYLIDNDNVVYDMEPPHGKIGTFNSETTEITLN
jgi:hypothetical protein